MACAPVFERPAGSFGTAKVSASHLLWFAIVSLCFAAAGVLGFVMARRDWRTFRRGFRKPILYGVPIERLASARPQWPAFETRWPNPWDGPPMPYVVLNAYARLADRARFATTLAAQALIVISGAWLSLTLVPIWEATLRSMEEGRQNSITSTSFNPLRWNPDVLVPMIPAFVLTVALAMMFRGRVYEQLQIEYDRASSLGDGRRSRSRLRQRRVSARNLSARPRDHWRRVDGSSRTASQLQAPRLSPAGSTIARAPYAESVEPEVPDPDSELRALRRDTDSLGPDLSSVADPLHVEEGPDELTLPARRFTRPGSLYWLIGAFLAGTSTFLVLGIGNLASSGRLFQELTWSNPATSLYAGGLLILTALFAFLAALRDGEGHNG
jgi:hypothetical protein